MRHNLLVLALVYSLVGFGPGQTHSQTLVSGQKANLNASGSRSFAPGKQVENAGARKTEKSLSSPSGPGLVSRSETSGTKRLTAEMFKSVTDPSAKVSRPPFPGSKAQPQMRNNLSTGAWIAIGVMIGVAVVVTVVLVKRCRNELGCGA